MFVKKISHEFFKCSIGVKWLAVTVFFILCSFLCKEQGITVVAVCVVYDAFCIVKVSTTRYAIETGIHKFPLLTK